MNKNQLILASLLSAALRNEDINNLDSFDLHDVDWSHIYEEARAHEVHTLIYPFIKQIKLVYPSEKKLLSKWQSQVLMSGIIQQKHIEQMEIILNDFNKSNINFIPLKGLVLRELYPFPEMRSMGDADILVDQRDIKKACQTLLNMGYKKQSTDSKHIHFIHNKHMSIEIHFLLISKDSLNKNTDRFEAEVWVNAKKSYVCNTPSLVLSLEDQLLHLIFHMAVHLSSGGFGLRQLCDLFVLIEKIYDYFNWKELYNKTSEYGVTHFAAALFIICKKLFNMQVPNLYNDQIRDYEYINVLIEDIFSGGIFGNRTMERTIGSIQLRYINPASDNEKNNPLKNIISLLFPPLKRMGIKYSYAKKSPILIPIVWLHRLLYGLIRRDFTLSEKKTMVIPNKAVSEDILNRAKLLHQFDLK